LTTPARQANIDRHVEQHRDIGIQVGDRKIGQRPDRVDTEFAPGALIGKRRCDVAIAHNVASGLERRSDQFVDVLGSIAGHEQGFGSCTQIHRRRTEQHRSDRPTDLGATRLTGPECVVQLGNASSLGRFAGPLAALECDEEASDHPSRLDPGTAHSARIIERNPS